jgi:putative addiction module killer protein
MQVRHYVTAAGKDPFQTWLDRLRDMKARIAIQRRIDRVVLGNLGEHRACREGVWELKVDVGPGYRVYYAVAGREIVLLLCAGDKRSQQADINAAVRYWNDYQRRSA